MAIVQARPSSCRYGHELARRLQVLHAGDLICEGTIKVAAEPAAKRAEAAEPEASTATADAAVRIVSVAPRKGGALAQETLRNAKSRPEVG